MKDGRGLLLLGAGYAIWALAFVVLYAMLSVGCAFSWEHVDLLGLVTLQQAQLVILFLLHAAVGAALALWLCRRQDRSTFLISAAWLAAIAALGSTLFSFAALFFLSPCI